MSTRWYQNLSCSTCPVSARPGPYCIGICQSLTCFCLSSSIMKQWGGKHAKACMVTHYQKTHLRGDTWKAIIGFLPLLAQHCSVSNLPMLQQHLLDKFAVIFGWRKSTLVTLDCEKLFVSMTEVITFTKSFCKPFHTLLSNS